MACISDNVLELTFGVGHSEVQLCQIQFDDNIAKQTSEKAMYFYYHDKHDRATDADWQEAGTMQATALLPSSCQETPLPCSPRQPA